MSRITRYADFLIDLLLICFQAMKESGLTWPLITEDEQERQMGRFVATVHFGDDLLGSFRDRALKQYIEAHPESELLASVNAERPTGCNASYLTSPTSTS